MANNKSGTDTSLMYEIAQTFITKGILAGTFAHGEALGVHNLSDVMLQQNCTAEGRPIEAISIRHALNNLTALGICRPIPRVGVFLATYDMTDHADIKQIFAHTINPMMTSLVNRAEYLDMDILSAKADEIMALKNIPSKPPGTPEEGKKIGQLLLLTNDFMVELFKKRPIMAKTFTDSFAKIVVAGHIHDKYIPSEFYDHFKTLLDALKEKDLKGAQNAWDEITSVFVGNEYTIAASEAGKPRSPLDFVRPIDKGYQIDYGM